MTTICSLRTVSPEDLAMLRAWRNNPAIRSVMLTQHEISESEHLEWFDRVSAEATKRLLILEEEEAPLAFVHFSGVVDGGVSEWGFYARPGAPKGTGSKLGEAALNHAFDELRLRKVYGQSIEGNDASIVLHRKLGFVQEGILRHHHRIGNTYHSVFCFGLLNEEWSATRQARQEDK